MQVRVCNSSHCRKKGEEQSADNFYKGMRVCKKCATAIALKYQRSRRGIFARMYSRQRNTSTQRKHPMPNYTLDQLVEWGVNQKVFIELHKAWVRGNYNRDLTPSCDRIDDYKPYTLDNLQIVTAKENNRRAHRDAISGKNRKQCKSVKQYTTNGVFIKEYFSRRNASRETGICLGSISKCVNGERNTGGSFIWK